MSALVELQDLRVDIATAGRARLILDGVTMQIGHGEAFGLVGESGSGKSTTARAVLAALPTGASVGGRVLFDGKDLYAMPRQALRQLRSRSIALVGQNPRATMNPVRRVGDYATEALRTNQNIPAAKARARMTSLLEEVGIDSPEQVLEQYPHQLSGGMLQRVVIAAALAVEPSLIIADEPTSALDMTSQAEVVVILNRLRRTHGTAVLFITHDLDLAAAVCDRTAVMYAGRIVEEQPSDRLHEHPQHPYSAGLANARTRVDIDIKRLQAIPGRPIAAFDRTDNSCSFAPRCQFAQSRCQQSSPPLEPTETGRVACWRHAEIAGQISLPIHASER